MKASINRDYVGSKSLKMDEKPNFLFNKKKSFFSSSVNFNQSKMGKNKLLIESYIQKYKAFCIGFVKTSEELRKLCENCKIQDLENFLEENLFCKAIFRFKVEQMFMNEANKLNKEKLIKDESKKLFEHYILDKEISKKLQKINNNLESRLKLIQGIDFLN